MAKVHERSRSCWSSWWATTCTARERPKDFLKKFEAALQAAARRRGQVLRVARKSRRPRGATQLSSCSTWTASCTTRFKAPKQSVRFFALESTYMDPDQLAWLEKELDGVGRRLEDRLYFHHPLYSSGEGHGSELKLREVLEPLFIKYGVSLVFDRARSLLRAHQAAEGDRRTSSRDRGASCGRGTSTGQTGLTASGFDTDRAFLLAEIDGTSCYFNAISRPARWWTPASSQRRKR